MNDLTLAEHVNNVIKPLERAEKAEAERDWLKALARRLASGLKNIWRSGGDPVDVPALLAEAREAGLLP